MPKTFLPPAFPITNPECIPFGMNAQDSNGMSLRDYFAAAALQAIIMGELGKGNGYGKTDAIDAYKMADCMLAVRAS